jgi:L-lactate dehydrogenase
MDSSSRIAIIGVGEVGGAVAYNLTLGALASELLLVDLDLTLRNAQVEDLSDVTYSTGSSTRVRPATFREAAQSNIVVITATSKQALGMGWTIVILICNLSNTMLTLLPIGQTTADYTSRNTFMIREVMDAMKPFRSDTILLVIANPVDLLTSIAQEMSGLPKSQVIGSGTSLDTSRLRGMVASRGSVSTHHCSTLCSHLWWLITYLSGLRLFHRCFCGWCSRRRPSYCMVDGNCWCSPHF